MKKEPINPTKDKAKECIQGLLNEAYVRYSTGDREANIKKIRSFWEKTWIPLKDLGFPMTTVNVN